MQHSFCSDKIVHDYCTTAVVCCMILGIILGTARFSQCSSFPLKTGSR